MRIQKNTTILQITNSEARPACVKCRDGIEIVIFQHGIQHDAIPITSMNNGHLPLHHHLLCCFSSFDRPKFATKITFFCASDKLEGSCPTFPSACPEKPYPIQSFYRRDIEYKHRYAA